MSAPLAYWHCGGEVIHRGARALGPHDGPALRGLYLDEAKAAAAAGDWAGLDRAMRLESELSKAIDAAERWRRAAAPLVRTAQCAAAR